MVDKSSIEKAKDVIEKVSLAKGVDKKMQESLDLARDFIATFKTEQGQRVLDHLDKYSHHNFPNYDNVNATYSKIGEQTLVEYIRAVLRKPIK